jgi:hypothetical protein
MLLPVTGTLSESWAKLDHAKRHVDVLREGLGDFADGEAHPIEVRRHFDAERSAIVCTAWPGFPKDAGLLVGDAVSNFRSSLNYLAWQLAVAHLGREPNETEARDIQFPILDKSKEHSWPNHPHRRYMSTAAASLAQDFQPFQVERNNPDMFSVLRILRDLSNHDKHRTIQVAAVGAYKVRLRVPHESTLRDCEYRSGTEHVLEMGENKPLRDGDEVALLYINATGSNPDVDLKPQLEGKAVFGAPNWDVVPALDAIGVVCVQIIRAFEPLFE